MKAMDIALKDLISSFRSAFAIVNMFVIPLLITAIFFVMFGGTGDEGFSVPVTKVSLVNLDQGSPEFAATAGTFGEGSASSLGELIASTLQSEELASLLEVSVASDAAAARTAVDSQQAGVAVIIPADFTARYMQFGEQATLEMYSDPTLTIGPGIVRSVIAQLLDGISGGRIAIEAAQQSASPADQALIGQIMAKYLEAQSANRDHQAQVELVSPAPRDASANLQRNILGPIMGGMLIFYAFYTGTAVAESILREEEQRTLPRLFTTPTPQAMILTGKFLAVFLTVLVQVVILLFAARLIYKIDWGAPLQVALLAGGTILSAATFGIFVNSFMKDPRQGGFIFGGVLTISGMLGMTPLFARGTETGEFMSRTVSLLVPQGWAMRALDQSMSQAPIGEMALTVLVLLGWALAFFLIGIRRFNKRYA